jgi:hypothetical protein
MRALRVVCLLVLSLFVEGSALAQSTEPGPGGKSVEDIQSIKRRAAEWLTMCMGDWDAQTHMSKSEWRTTCERVSREREQFLLNTPGAKSIGTRGKQ